ncbi:uncharacterized protein LOC122620292 [Drosophila teissieri]|uniref:uncharacterized protein LOC122620292 n=1 Tax=Drosophila teissieri TaxID=7243 RepID=UPI001CBA5696|nr:uncharacterized protein LOC122620292 [Drosophila teissieri]
MHRSPRALARALKVKPKHLCKKPKALIVKKTGEASNTEKLRKLKSYPSLRELGKHVRKIQRTHQGELRLKVEGKASECVHKLKSDLEATLKEMALLVALSCSGMDEARTAEELHSCLVIQWGHSSMSLDESGKASIKCYSPFHVQELASSPMRGIAYTRPAKTEGNGNQCIQPQ